MIYVILVVPRKHVSLGEPFVVSYFVWESSLA